MNRMVNRSRRQQRRRQRGGANESLEQGQMFQKHHVNQHGGSRALEGAPLDYTGVLDSSLRAGARLEQYDAHFRDAQAQSGGSRRSRSRQNKSRQNKSRSNKSRRNRQRGGGVSPADANASYTLLPSYAGAGVPPPPAQGALVPYTVVGGDRLSPASMKGGSRKSQKKSRKNKSQKNRRNKSRRQRGGFSPVGHPSMLLSTSEYSKAGLHPEFKNPLLLN
jgi:hypothetical protein